MTPRELIAAFETLAGAPDGVNRVRELVLHLAVRGKLIDGGLPCVMSERGPYTLPTGWRWAVTAELGEIKLGRQRSPENHVGPHMVPYLRVANVHEGRIDTSDVKSMNFSPEEQAIFRLLNGDVLLNEGQSRELVGRPAIYRDDVPGSCFQNTLLRFRPNKSLISEYALLVFRSYMRSGRFQAAAQQTTNIAHLSAKRLAAIEFPLPPLAEQHRIVARVDELMGLLDRLEAACTARDEVRRAARDAALAALRDAEDAEAVEAAWARVSCQMDALFTDPEDVAPLRHTILQLAVQGRLVRQDPNDEDASLLLRGVTSGRTGRPAMSAHASPGDESLNLPSGWTWTTVAEIARDGVESVSDGPFGSKLKGEHYVQTPGCRVVRLGNIGRGIFKDEDKAYITGEYFAELSSYHLEAGDILVASLGDPPGRACLVPASVLPALNKADCFRVRPHPGIYARYIVIVLNSPSGVARSLALHRGDTRGRINLTHLRTAPIPLPPLAEQHRIAAKVDALMAQCDQLEARLTAARELQAQFAAAAVHHLDV